MDPDRIYCLLFAPFGLLAFLLYVLAVYGGEDE